MMMTMGWKCHSKVLALPPPSYSPKQITSINFPSSSKYNYNNIFTINNNRNNQLSSRWIGTPLFSSSSDSHTYYHTGSTPPEEEVNYNYKDDCNYSGNFIDLLSKMLASLLSYGVVFIFITMAACMHNPYSALAASCGRMGGSSSYSSHGSSSSSSGSSDSYDYDDYENYSRRLAFICTCDSNCTQCNCNIKEKDNEEEANTKAKGNTCTCNCHKSCYFHRIRKDYNPWIAYIYIIGTIIATVVSEWCDDDDTPPVQPIGTMLCFQVAVSDKERVLQRKLNHIAEVADTSTLKGLNYVLKEVVKALLQQNEFSFQFSSLSIEYDSMESLSKRFKQIIKSERVKYGEDEETFVNVDGVKYKKNSMVEANSSNIENEYTLATVSVLATGKHLIPSTNKKRHVYLDSAAVLQMLKSIPKTEIRSVEVLWSPQREDDVLLKEPGMFKDEPGRDCQTMIGLGKEGRIYMQ